MTNEALIFERLRIAFRNKQRLQIVYATGAITPGEEVVKTRNIDIYGLGDEYLEAYCHYRKGIRTFKVDRILDASLLPEKFQIPHAYVANTWVTDGDGTIEEIGDTKKYYDVVVCKICSKKFPIPYGQGFIHIICPECGNEWQETV